MIQVKPYSLKLVLSCIDAATSAQKPSLTEINPKVIVGCARNSLNFIPQAETKCKLKRFQFS